MNISEWLKNILNHMPKINLYTALFSHAISN